jgi:hypothetical protein
MTRRAHAHDERDAIRDLEPEIRTPGGSSDPGRLSERQAAYRLILGTFRKIADLNESQLVLLEQFLEQIIQVHDPDAVTTFLRWKEHPVLDTILLLASKLDEEDQYEVLYRAEDLAAEAGRLSPAGPDAEKAEKAH